MQFYSLGQPTMLGFLTRLNTDPEGLWLNYYFYYSKACSVLPCTALRLYQQHNSYIYYRKATVTTAVLRITGVLGKILIR